MSDSPTDAAYFSPRAIKANEEAVRKMFDAKPGDDPSLASRSRMGRRIGPAAIRALLDEINRGTPHEVYAPAYLTVIAWMLANTVATEPDLGKRMEALGRHFAFLEQETISFAGVNDTVNPGKAAYGEAIGGHA